MNWYVILEFTVYCIDIIAWCEFTYDMLMHFQEMQVTCDHHLINLLAMKSILHLSVKGGLDQNPLIGLAIFSFSGLFDQLHLHSEN